MKDPVDLAIVEGVLEVLILCIMVKVIVESGVVDSVYIDMSVGSRKEFSEKGIMPLGIGSMGRIEFL